MRIIAIMIVLLGALGPAAPVLGQDAGQDGSAPSCAIAPPDMVGAALGLKLDPPVQSSDGAMTWCVYPGTGSSATVLIRIAVGASVDSLETEREGFDSHGQPTTPIDGLGDAAFSTTVAAGVIQAASVEAVKGSTMIFVTAPASLVQVEGLVSLLLSPL